MPTNSTKKINPLRPGLAMKARPILSFKISTMKPMRMRKTTIRTRKMRGDESRR